MYSITVNEILEATGGVLLSGNGDTLITDLCTDSRLAKEGDLFVPIVGERDDGHMFIESALTKAAATLTQEHSGVVISDKPYIAVKDTKKAMQDIGSYFRDKFDIPVIGVTGSVGKTTTREMIATALSGCARVYQTEKNYNSQVGLPIALFHMDENAECAVLEMGMSEPGEMERLSEIARPTICAITMIGVAHIENLGSQENIRKEKLAITSHMDQNGILFLNGNDPLLKEMNGRLTIPCRYFGTEEWCECRAENISMRSDYTYEYDYVHKDKRVHVHLNALGRHNVINSLCGMAIADHLGHDLEKAAAQFETFKGIRQKLIRIPNKYTIIDDAYNASPDSMKASISVLSEIETEGKKIAVLGDMFELGENSEAYHYEVGRFLADKDVDELVVVGEQSLAIRRAVEESGSKIRCYSFKDNGEVVLYLLSVLNPEDIVLVKGSNGMNLKEVVDNLLG